MVRGTMAEILASNPVAWYSGDCLPIGIATDTGAIMTYVNGQWSSGAPSFASYDALVASGYRGLATVDGVVYAWSESLGRMVAQSPANARNPPMPRGGRMAQLGSSTTANGIATVSGIQMMQARSTLSEINIALGSPWELRAWGYTGQTVEVVLSHLDEVLAWSPDGIVLQLNANDLNVNTEAVAETAFGIAKNCALDLMAKGIFVAIQTPHYNGSNWRAALYYDTKCQEWGARYGVPVISGPYAIASGVDKIGTAKSGYMEMPGGLHVTDLGARDGYGVYGALAMSRNGLRFILPGGSAQVASELHTNPRMTGSEAVTVGETGCSGTRPLNWTLSRSGAATIASSIGSDSEGAYWDLAITSTASDEYVTVQDAGFTTALAGKTAFVFRQLIDYDIRTAGACESVRGYIPFLSGTIQHPNGNSSSFSGVQPTGRRFLCGPEIDIALTGKSMAANTAGCRISFSGAGSSVVRLRGISSRDSSW